jgi:hypothetical protein
MTDLQEPTVAWIHRNPAPPAPQRDLWWHAQRIAVPDTGDWTARHQRGVVRLPYDVGQPAGTLVPAWVCCDPGCGGVELGWSVLELNHGCCGFTLRGNPVLNGGRPERRGVHRTGLGTVHFRGFHHGPFTAWWEPGGTR